MTQEEMAKIQNEFAEELRAYYRNREILEARHDKAIENYRRELRRYYGTPGVKNDRY